MTNRVEEIDRKIDREVAGALTIDTRGPGVFTIAPRSMSEVMEFAKLMAVSGVCVRPQFRGSPGACLAITIQAMKWGADPFAVANKAYVVKNRAGEETLAYEAQLIHAIVNASPVLAQRLRPTYEGQGASRRCRIVGYVRGEEKPLEYESPPVSQIGVKNSPLWVSDPDQQLFYYSSRAWARRHVPEILLGIYAPDEFEGETIDLTPDGAPEPQMPIGAGSTIAGNEKDDRPEFSVVDVDGVVETFRSGERAIELLDNQITEATKLGLPQLEGLWESNVELVELLACEGFAEQAGDLTTRFMEAREGLQRAAADAAKASAEADARRQAEERERENERLRLEEAAAEQERQREIEAARQADAAADQQHLQEEYPEERSGTAREAPSTGMRDGTATAPVQTAPETSVGVQPAAPPPSTDTERRVPRPAPRQQQASQEAPAERRDPRSGPGGRDAGSAEPQTGQPGRLHIAMPMKSGKPQIRVWAVALAMPKMKRLTTRDDVLQFSADNADNLELAYRTLDKEDEGALRQALAEAIDRTEERAGA